MVLGSIVLVVVMKLHEMQLTIGKRVRIVRHTLDGMIGKEGILVHTGDQCPYGKDIKNGDVMFTIVYGHILVHDEVSGDHCSYGAHHSSLEIVRDGEPLIGERL